MNKAGVELGFISYLIDTGDIDIVYKNGISVDGFTVFGDIFEFIIQYYEFHNNTMPNPQTLGSRFSEFEWVSYKQEDISVWLYMLKEEMRYKKYLPILQKTMALAESNMNEALSYLRDNAEVLDDLYEEVKPIDILKDITVEQVMKKEEAFSCGIEGLDEFLGGGYAKHGDDLIGFLARTGGGKTFVMLLSAYEALKQGKRVGFISPEMSAESVSRRLDSIIMKMYSKNIYSEEVNTIQLQQYKDSIEGKFLYTNLANFQNELTPSKIRSFCQQEKLDILFIDGIRYVSSGTRNDKRDKQEQMMDVATRLKKVSADLHIPIIFAVQANRTGDAVTGRLDTTNIAMSDGIAQVATKIVAITWLKNSETENDNERHLVLEVIKNRDGVSGKACKYLTNFGIGKLELVERGYAHHIFGTGKKARGSSESTTLRAQEVTVENYINAPSYVSEETKERVKKFRSQSSMGTGGDYGGAVDSADLEVF